MKTSPTQDWLIARIMIYSEERTLTRVFLEDLLENTIGKPYKILEELYSLVDDGIVVEEGPETSGEEEPCFWLKAQWKFLLDN